MADAEAGPTSSARTSEVLDPSFVGGVEELSIEELRGRRDLALAEREFQSYLRRLVQVRQDILRAERERRATGEGPQPLVERLTSVLSLGPRSPGRGEALRETLTEEDMAEAERRADAVVGRAGITGPEELSDADLDQALEALEQSERAISVDRAAVLRVHDRLQEELKRRYQQDPSLVIRDL
jgi:hypothetical protein